MHVLLECCKLMRTSDSNQLTLYQLSNDDICHHGLSILVWAYTL